MSVFKGLKSVLITLLVLAGIAYGLWQQCYEITTVVSDLGMDDMGRQVFCQTLEEPDMEPGDVKMLCEGFHHQTFVLSMKNAAPIVFGRVLPDEVVTHMNKPYAVALEGFKGLILSGDKLARKLDEPVPIDIIKQRLNNLGVKTVGDFWAACGFERFIIRDEEEDSLYLDLRFSPKSYGSNPIVVDPFNSK